MLHIPTSGGFHLFGKATLLSTHAEPRHGSSHLRFSADSLLKGTLTTSEEGVVEAFSDQMYDLNGESSERSFAKAGKSIAADIQAHLPTPVDEFIRADVRPVYKRAGKPPGVLLTAVDSSCSHQRSRYRALAFEAY